MNLRIHLAWVALCIGCIAPEDKYDEFVKAKAAFDAGTPVAHEGGGNETPLKPEQITGTYLYAVSIKLNAPSPIVYLLDIEASAIPGSTDLEIRLQETPLSFADRKTPVGEPGAWRVERVSSTGDYMSAVVHTIVPPLANATLPNTEGVSDVTFSGNFINPATPDKPDAKVEFWCGTVSGVAQSVVGPLDVAGSTFTATRVNDPNKLPDVVINCNKTPAAAL